MKQIDSLWSRIPVALAYAGLTVMAHADFSDDFDAYTPGTALPPPWANNNLVSGTSDLLSATPAGAGYNGTLGAHGPSGNWWEAGQPTNYDPGQLVHQFSWKAHLAPENGIPRINAGVGKSVAFGILTFEMDGGALTISPSIGTNTFPSSVVTIAKGPWYEISVTLVNDGLANWSWSGQVDVDAGGGTFVPHATMPGGALPAGYAPESVQLSSIFSFVEPGGTSALDDVAFQVKPVQAVAFTNVVVADTVGAEFLSELGAVYELQSTPNLLNSNDWMSTGAFVNGNGTNMFLFDASGFSSNKNYRVVANP